VTAFSIEGKRFLITGATGGIGSAIALGFARAGASILANYGHREEPAHALATEAAREGLDIQLIRADITSLEGRGRLVTAVGERGLDGIVHSAATGIHR
jgi:NAD(P)-dependent dehydrogenase (short-subunit alcohol dehydrogenase family)